jgi:imidazolonepropionase-like amidohydrolase
VRRSRATMVLTMALTMAATMPVWALALLGACGGAGSSPARSGPAGAAAVAAPAHAYRAYVGATLIASPGSPPIADAAILLDGARIAALGPRAEVALPPGTEIIDASGATITAAFWNTHVHLMEPALQGASTAPAVQLGEGLHQLATRWGFAHVVDTGSDLSNSAALRRRLAAGELRGPSLRLAGMGGVPVGGQPVYIPFPLPTLGTPAEGTAAVQALLDGGADAIKLMTASVVANPPSPVMPVPVVRAVTTAAHARGALVIAHPTNLAGVLAARDGGVDILAHTAPQDGPWTAEQASSLVRAGMSLTPTLSLWRLEIPVAKIADRFEAAAIDQVRSFAAAGGTLLFGTDVGYRPEHDPTAEHQLLARAGLSFAARLAMLTTAPAARFGAADRGRLAVGLAADLVVLEGDPARDPAVFARARCTVRDGIVIHAAGACGR